MATWKTRGLRGSLFEELINRTNENHDRDDEGWYEYHCLGQ